MRSVDHLSLSGDRCLRFMYNMFGNVNMGTLLVYQTKDSLKLEDPVWFKDGNQSSPWRKATIDINHKAGHKVCDEMKSSSNS